MLSERWSYPAYCRCCLYVAPLGAVLHVTPLTLMEWVGLLACSVVAAIVGRTIKFWRVR